MEVSLINPRHARPSPFRQNYASQLCLLRVPFHLQLKVSTVMQSSSSPPRLAFLSSVPLHRPSHRPSLVHRQPTPRAATSSYDDFDKLLGGGGNSGDAPRQAKKPDPRDYSRFDNLLDRTGGESRKLKSQKRYLGRPQTKAPRDAGADAGVGSSAGASAEEYFGDVPEADTRSLTGEDVESGYAAMDKFLDGGGEKPTQLAKPSRPDDPENWRENWDGVPDPTRKTVASLDGMPKAGGPKPQLAQKPGARRETSGVSKDRGHLPKPDTRPLSSEEVASGYAAMDAFLGAKKPELKKPGARLITDDPSTWRDWEGVPDPTRKTVASLDGLPKAGGGPKPVLFQKPAARNVADGSVVPETDEVRQPMEPVPAADTTPLGPEEIATGFAAMDEFLMGGGEVKKGSARVADDPTRKKVADLDGLPKASGASKPTLVKKPGEPARPELAESEKLPVPNLAKPVLRRLSNDPDTWRENWEGVSDPTRKAVANLDSEPEPAGPQPTLVQKPATPVPVVEDKPLLLETELSKPARRVTDDPVTWREDWAGVPDPTRKSVADLDSPLPKIGNLSSTDITNKPTAPSPEVVQASLAIKKDNSVSFAPRRELKGPPMKLVNPKLAPSRSPKSSTAPTSERVSYSSDGQPRNGD